MLEIWTQSPWYGASETRQLHTVGVGTEPFSGGPLSLQPPYPILYPFLCSQTCGGLMQMRMDSPKEPRPSAFMDSECVTPAL